MFLGLQKIIMNDVNFVVLGSKYMPDMITFLFIFSKNALVKIHGITITFMFRHERIVPASFLVISTDISIFVIIVLLDPKIIHAPSTSYRNLLEFEEDLSIIMPDIEKTFTLEDSVATATEFHDSVTVEESIVVDNGPNHQDVEISSESENDEVNYLPSYKYLAGAKTRQLC